MSDIGNWIGRQERRIDYVTAATLARYCATIQGAANPSSGLAPPGFHWCLCTPEAAMEELGEDGHPRTGGFIPTLPLTRRMWAASEIDFVGPIAPGDTIEKISTISSIHEKRGKSGLLIFIDVTHVVRSNGALVIRETQSIVFREVMKISAPHADDTRADPSAWPIVRTLTPSTLLLFRYSALTFNAHRIHYDLPYTQECEGYPALIVHAPLIASSLLSLAAQELATGSVKRFKFRALSPAFVAEELYLVARPISDRFALAAMLADGRIIMEAEAE